MFLFGVRRAAPVWFFCCAKHQATRSWRGRKEKTKAAMLAALQIAQPHCHGHEKRLRNRCQPLAAEHKPLTNDKPMPQAEQYRVLLAASEVVGFAKTGGLADVVGSLPQALARRRHHCVVTLPLYRCTLNARVPPE